MQVLQNMRVKDIINRKTINDELFLLKTNVKSIMLSWRITRTPYFLSIILVYLSYISMPAKLLEPVILLGLSPEYEEGIISFIGYANLVVSLLIFSVLAIRRILDADRKWISGFVILAGIYTLYTNYLNYSPPILVVSYTEDMLATAMSVDLNIWVVGLLILSLFPSNEYDNAYGLSYCIEQVSSGFIRINFGGFEQFLDEFSLYKIAPIFKKILSTELFNWRGRISRGELIYYYMVYQIMVLLLVILIYSIGTILSTISLEHIFLIFIVSIFWIWCFIYILRILILRLHDSYSSAFWIFGLFIPYVNIYVIYLLLVKGSWQYIEPLK